MGGPASTEEGVLPPSKAAQRIKKPVVQGLVWEVFRKEGSSA